MTIYGIQERSWANRICDSIHRFILQIIDGAYDKIEAPAEIWKMAQLRVLDVERLSLPNPPRIDDFWILGKLLRLGNVENFSLSDDVCKRISNIKQLNLIYDDEASMYYYLRNLGRFHKLESLKCSFYGKPSWCPFARDLTFPRSLKELHLANFPLRWEDLTMISLLPHLVLLRLKNSVHGSEWNAIDMGFPSLKFLRIYWCDSLASWNAESSHFSVLEDLLLMGSHKLDEIPSSIGDIPTLKRITMISCSDSAVISAVKILVEQQELGNDGLHVEIAFENKEKLQSFSEMLGEEGLTCNNLSLKQW